jgi:hypothetical protein
MNSDSALARVCPPGDAVEPRRSGRRVLARGFGHQLPAAGGRLPLLGNAGAVGDGEMLVERRDLAAAATAGHGGGVGTIGGGGLVLLRRRRRRRRKGRRGDGGGGC